MNIEKLLEAAKVLDEREKAKKPAHGSLKREKKISKRSPSYSRTTHNQLEKNRRAHLRDCLELLKELVPSPPDHQKATTLALLQSAEQYIKVLQITERDALETKKKLSQQRNSLKERLKRLQPPGKKRPRSSEGGSTSSEDIDVDIDVENDHDEEMGYTSCSSGSEDSCSTGSSGGSDGGLTAKSRRGLV